MNTAGAPTFIERRSDVPINYWNARHFLITLPLPYEVDFTNIQYFRAGWRVSVSPDIPLLPANYAWMGVVHHGFGTHTARQSAIDHHDPTQSASSVNLYCPFTVAVNNNETISIITNSYYVRQNPNDYSITGHYGSLTGNAYSSLRKSTKYSGILISDVILDTQTPVKSRHTISFLSTYTFDTASPELFHRMMYAAHDNLATVAPYSSYYTRVTLNNTTFNELYHGPLKHFTYMIAAPSEFFVAVHEMAAVAVYANQL